MDFCIFKRQENIRSVPLKAFLVINPDTPTDMWRCTSASSVSSERHCQDKSALTNTQFPHRWQRGKPTDSVSHHNGLFERYGHVSPTFRSVTSEFIWDWRKEAFVAKKTTQIQKIKDKKEPLRRKRSPEINIFLLKITKNATYLKMSFPKWGIKNIYLPGHADEWKWN